ncbi:cytochrome c biogenesis FN [Capsicum annuum]|nr:cytochrome c biogenesis FN [Capsicum annuum]
MRCLGHHHLERRVKDFGSVAFPVPPSSGGAYVEGALPEIGLEALTLPTSRELIAIGHDYYQKAPMKINISHGGVCNFMLGVLQSCDPTDYVRPVTHASYLFRAGGVNSDSIWIQASGPVDPQQVGVDLVAFAVYLFPNVDLTQLTGDSRSTRSFQGRRPGYLVLF